MDCPIASHEHVRNEMRVSQGGHGHLAPHRLGNAVVPAQIVSYARLPADIGIPSIRQRLSRNSKQVPLLPEAAREGAHEGHVFAQAHAGEHELGEPPRQARAGDLCPRLRESSRQPRRSPSTAAPVLMIPKTKNGRSIASSASMRGLIVSGIFGLPKNSVPSGAR